MGRIRKIRTAMAAAIFTLVVAACSIVLAPTASASGRADCNNNEACGWIDAYFGGSSTWTVTSNQNYTLGWPWNNEFSSVRSVHLGCAYYRDYSGGVYNIHLKKNYQITNLGTDFPPLQDKISYVQLQGAVC